MIIFDKVEEDYDYEKLVFIVDKQNGQGNNNDDNEEVEYPGDMQGVNKENKAFSATLQNSKKGTF